MDDVQPEVTATAEPTPAANETPSTATAPPPDTVMAAAFGAIAPKVEGSKPAGPRPDRANRPAGQGRENRPPREAKSGDAKPADAKSGDAKASGADKRPERGNDRGDRRGGEHGGERQSGERYGGDKRGGRDSREGRPGGGGRPFDAAPDIELEKLIADSLYLDNQAHAVVARMRDMDSGTKSQLRRLYNAVRRAVRAPEGERQHEFVMLRARLAYTIARHSLRSLDALERLLLQVTRRNDARGYERFKDLFEAIVAYNE